MTIRLLLLSLAFSQPILATHIDVKDHGIFPGKDVTFEINELFRSIRGKPNVTIQFPKGTYHFHPENATEMHRAVSNHDNSLKRLAFPLLGLENITILGSGSTFLFHGRIVPFTIDGTKGATLKNFSIDWARSFHDELHIVESDKKAGTFVAEIDRALYPFSLKHGEFLSDKAIWQDPMGSNIVFDPVTRAPIHDTRSYSVNFSNPYQATAIGEDRVKFKARFRKEPPPVGSVLISYGVHPTSRLCPAIHVANSSDIVLENITIHEAGGMGVIAERTDNIRLDGVKVTSNEQRLVATRADATHFIGCKGTVHIENCLFEHMLDDAANIHGAYVKVVDYLGDRQFLCEISHFQQWGLIFAGKGDKVALLSRETILPFHQATVTDFRILNEHRFLLTVDEVPSPLPKGPVSVENLTWYPDLVMRKNIIRENRARSVLVTTKGKVTIEDNYFSSQMHGILIEGDNNVWYESGSVEDVTIRNNTFVNIGYEGTNRYPLFAAPLLNKTQHMGEGHYHRNIRFLNNTIKSFNGHIVHATSVEGLEISGNTIEYSDDYPEMEKHPPIDLTYCSDVVISNNKVTGFEGDLKINPSADTRNVTIEANSGLSK